jgi:hypothetical protein
LKLTAAELVMRGLVPHIHVFADGGKQGVDGRDEHGRDDAGSYSA